MYDKCTVKPSVHRESSVKHTVFMSIYAKTRRTTGALDRWFQLKTVGLYGRPDARKKIADYPRGDGARDHTHRYICADHSWGQWIYPQTTVIVTKFFGIY